MGYGIREEEAMHSRQQDENKTALILTLTDADANDVGEEIGSRN
jgi:hypothetical protein